MAARGDARTGPHGAVVRCFDPGLRSSRWISQGGEAYTLYHDTETWSDMMLPHCDGGGALRLPNNQRLERALAEAWVLRVDHTGVCRAQLRDATGGVTADNVEWRYGRSVGRRAAKVPPCVQAAARALADEAPLSLEEAAAKAGLSEATLLNYLCKGLCRDAALLAPAALHPLVGGAIMEALRAVPTKGCLADVVAAVDAHLGEPTSHLHNRVRLGRIVLDAQHGRHAGAAGA